MTRNPHPLRCPHCHAEFFDPSEVSGAGRWRRWRGGLLVGALVLLGILLAAYRYQGQLVTLLDLANDATGSTTLSLTALALILLVVAGLAAWFLLPFLLAWAYLDLRRRLRPTPGTPAPQADPGRSSGSVPQTPSNS